MGRRRPPKDEMQKTRLECLKWDGTLFWMFACGACRGKGATGVHRSVALDMQLVIARLFREPHLQFTWIGDRQLCGHGFASQFGVYNGCGDAHAPTREIDYRDTKYQSTSIPELRQQHNQKLARTSLLQVGAPRGRCALRRLPKPGKHVQHH